MRAPAAFIHRGLAWTPCVPYAMNYFTGEPISQCGSVSDQMPCVTGVPQFPGSGYCPTTMPGFPVMDLAGYPIGLEGLGDCGTSPCGFTDLFFTSSDCANYTACVAASAANSAAAAVAPAPTAANLPASGIYANPLYSALPGSSTPYTPADLAAQAAGAAPGTAFSAMTAAQQAAYLAATASPAPATTGMPTWLPWALGGFAFLVLLMSMGGRRR